MIFFGVKFFLFSVTHLFSYSTNTYLSNDARKALIRVCMQKLCHSEIDLLVFTPIIREDGVLAPIIHGKRDIHVFVM